MKQLICHSLKYTVAMAFYEFKKEKVDIAIIETGLGGRLDSTNIVNPFYLLLQI